MEPPRLAEHDPRWAERFAAEAEAIRLALGDLAVAVEHVGSTAVEGLAAKPTIDIVVGVTTLDLPEDAVERMVALGYEDARDDSRPGERRFRKGATVPREVIVHLVEHGGEEWRNDLQFRDALRVDAELAKAYEELKRRLLAERGTWYSGRDKEALHPRRTGRASPTRRPRRPRPRPWAPRSPAASVRGTSSSSPASWAPARRRSCAARAVRSA